jgi:hypothetical protein
MGREGRNITMIRVGPILRWAGAVVVAFLAYIVAFAVGYLTWRKFGGDPEEATRWILAIATCSAVLAGAFAAPAKHRMAAALAIWVLALLFPVTLVLKNTLAGHFTTMNLFEIAGTLFGGLPGYYVARIAPHSARKREG